MAGRTVGQALALSIGVLFVCAVVGIGLALAANSRLSSRRRFVVDQITPAQLAALALQSALVNEEAGTRGYLITRRPQFLEPYRLGLAAEARSYAQLAVLDEHGRAGGYADAVALVQARADGWRGAFVAAALPGGHHSTLPMQALIAADRTHFAPVTEALGALQSRLARARADARRDLFDAAAQLRVILILTGALMVLGILGAAVLLRRLILIPLAMLGREARRVARGEFQTPLMRVDGPREIVEVAADVEAMRERIVHELSAVQAASALLEEQAEELTRSNVELEQFAYVASHDLQEPLRKVASFCQALERRYHGQLDDRADQYIEFAVDGAKRMQILINDLLAFSRVGRGGHQPVLLDAGELVAQAASSLSGAIDDAGATLVAADLPVVRGDRTLLVSVFQNLIANAVKFRGPEPPVVRIEARRDGGCWEFTCADNGIGIDADYAERIFVIFQRLHTKEVYPGTGIGLAMCRKIVERHGGRIWLDTGYTGGTCLRFTLPIPEEDQP
jgi:signal transduction histidine kinase